MDLINAVEFMFRESRCGLNKELLEVFQFEEESEVYFVLTEAVTQARLSLGMDQELEQVRYARAM